MIITTNVLDVNLVSTEFTCDMTLYWCLRSVSSYILASKTTSSYTQPSEVKTFFQLNFSVSFSLNSNVFPSTCFYALCLISKTPAGAGVLLEEGWTTVHHSMEEKWPLVFDHQHEMMEEGAFLSPEPSPVQSFPPLYGSFNIDTLPSVYRTPQMHKVASYESGIGREDIPMQRKLRRGLGHSTSDIFGGDTRKGESERTEGSGSPLHSRAALGRTVSRRNRRFVLSAKEPSRKPSLLRLQLDKTSGGIGQSLSFSKRERPQSVADLRFQEQRSQR